MALLNVEDLIEFFDKSVKDNPFVVVLKNMAPFPLLMYLGLPILVFASLFYIPENYAGMFPFSQSIPGTYQNKWLFDMLGLYNIIFFIVCLLKYFTVGLPNQVEVALQNFIKKSNPEIFKIQHINMLILFCILLSMGWACIFTFHKLASHGVLFVSSYMNYSTWNRNVFANFFIRSGQVCVAQMIATCAAIYALELRRMVKRNVL